MYNPLYGVVNKVLKGVGLDFLARAWLADPTWALPSIIVAAVWTHVGFCFVIILAGLQNINPELIEAALIDGANAWQRFIYVIIAELRHVLTMLITFTLIGGFQVFDLIWIMNRGGPGTASQVITTYIYKIAFRESDIGYSAAVSMVLTSLALVTSYIFIRVRERGE